MIADYAADPKLYEQCLTLIDSCFPGIKAVADKGRTLHAAWDKASIPFIVKVDDALIAHLGILSFHFLIHGKSYQAAAIHGICTQPEYRRKGYFKQLMKEALHYIQHHYDFAFLFTDKPQLYKQFGFKIIEEYDFNYIPAAQTNTDVIPRKLNLDNPVDLNLMQDLYLNRIPLSKNFSIVDEIMVATLNVMHEPVYYLENMNTLLIYQIKSEILYLKDIISTQSHSLDLILSTIPENFSQAILQFCPDNFLNPPFSAVQAKPECYFMLSDNFTLDDFQFRFPEPQRC